MPIRAEIAREIADITVAADDLAEILVLRMLSNRLMKRIHKNYRFIVTFNAGLILLRTRFHRVKRKLALYSC